MFLLGLGVALGAGCSTAFKRVRQASDLLGVIPQAKGLSKQIKRYADLAARFKRFHDSGELRPDDVLAVLKVTGVVPGAPGAAPGGPAAGREAIPPPVSNYEGGYRWPLDAGVVSSEFGGRWGKKHEGMDLAADAGVPVRAVAEGVVIYAGSGLTGYGNVIILRHDDRRTTLYAHNQSLSVAERARVASGQQVALLGSTGRSTGPHVHFEFRDGERAINPREVLPRSSGLAQLVGPQMVLQEVAELGHDFGFDLAGALAGQAVEVGDFLERLGLLG